MNTHFECSEEVRSALENNAPILALESTLISHGLPYPDNLNIAREVEEITRQQSVVPATIAIINGKIKIGLSAPELELLAKRKNIIKVSVRDIPYVVSQNLHGGTTVAATLFLAAKAGIKVMATGGIGGVHRGHDLDISADLIELAKTQMAVVCAGAKSILDLSRTLEFLETYSVPVIGYKTECFPAFYSAKSSHPLTASVNNMDHLSHLIQTHFSLNIPSSIIVANPIPKENEIPAAIIEPAILSALHQASINNISGKAITPFLLKTLAEITDGKSLGANLALIRNNVKIGAMLTSTLYKQNPRFAQWTSNPINSGLLVPNLG
jgi:pseudouridine-5'-phosphate glycosidase